MIYSMMAGDLPYRLKEMHDRYGPVVRVAPDELSFIDGTAWKDIYSKKEYIRPPQWRNRLPGKNCDHLISADADTHTRFRRCFNSAFSEHALQNQEPIIQGYVSKLMERFQEVTDDVVSAGVVNVVHLFNYTAFDIIGDLGWGKNFGGLDKLEYHPWVTVILHFKMTMFVAALKYYPWLDRLMQAMTPASALESIRMITDTAEKNMAARKALADDRPDIMSYAFKYNSSVADPSAQLSTEELETNGMTFIVGGSDTVTTAMAGITNNLLQNPTTLERLTKEIRSAFANEGDITATSTAALPYLRAVMDEALRMCPPVPDILRRKIVGGDTVIAGVAVPDGTVVGIPMWPAFRSSYNFVKPDDFRPDRWLSGESPSEFRRDKKVAFQPFSVGPAGCIGQNLARMELRLVLCRFLWSFDISVPQGESSLDWASQKIWWSWNKEPVRVKLSRVR